MCIDIEWPGAVKHETNPEKFTAYKVVARSYNEDHPEANYESLMHPEKRSPQWQFGTSTGGQAYYATGVESVDDDEGVGFYCFSDKDQAEKYYWIWSERGQNWAVLVEVEVPKGAPIIWEYRFSGRSTRFVTKRLTVVRELL